MLMNFFIKRKFAGAKYLYGVWFSLDLIMMSVLKFNSVM